MHELGIARNLFEIVRRKAEEAHLSKVHKIKIILGEACGVEEGLLRHSLIEHLMPGTIAQDAELEVQIQPLKAKCQGCGRQILKQSFNISQHQKKNVYCWEKKDLNPVISENLACPDCGCLEVDIIEGKDVYVESIEAE